MDDDHRAGTKPVHQIGAVLDDLSVGEIEERIALLHQEISRLEAAKIRKRGAHDFASSVRAGSGLKAFRFGTGRGRSDPIAAG